MQVISIGSISEHFNGEPIQVLLIGKMANYTYAQLMQIWTANGGSSTWAPMAAAVAMAESGGNSDSISKSNDYGLWQINNGGQAMLDPNANAKRAIAMSNNGATWKPWCTAYADGACGTKGGGYLGAGSPFMKYLNGSAGQIPGTGGAIGSSPVTGDSGSGATLLSTKDNCLWSFHIPGASGDQCLFQAGWARAALGGIIIFGGAVILSIGLTLLAYQKMPESVKKLAKFGAEAAVL